jgi:hypothetical protein
MVRRKTRSKRAPPSVIDYTARELLTRMRDIEHAIRAVSGGPARVLAIEHRRLMRAWWTLPNADVSAALWHTPIARRGGFSLE